MRLLIMRGVSGSGKSTYARNTGYYIVSRDIIRQQFGATEKTVLSKENENLVTEIEYDLVREALYRGQNVVVDDTNTTIGNARKLMNLAHSMCIPAHVHTMDTPLQTCIARSPLPEYIVKQQWVTLQRNPVLEASVPLLTKLTPPNSGWNAYIFDIDGTLAKIDPDNPRDVYDGSRVGEDVCVTEVADVLNALMDENYVYVVSGRDEKYRKITSEWLSSSGIVYDELFMRKEGDKRPDSLVKYEILRDNIYGELYRGIAGVFDDRERVLDMWRAQGIKTFDVGQGVSKF